MTHKEFIKKTTAHFEKFNQGVKCTHLAIRQEDGSYIRIPLDQVTPLLVFEALQPSSVTQTT